MTLSTRLEFEQRTVFICIYAEKKCDGIIIHKPNMDITTIKPTVSQHFDDEIQRFTVLTLISFLLYFKLRKLSKIFLVFVCTFDIETTNLYIQNIQTIRVECNEIFDKATLKLTIISVNL